MNQEQKGIILKDQRSGIRGKPELSGDTRCPPFNDPEVFKDFGDK